MSNSKLNAIKKKLNKALKELDSKTKEDKESLKELSKIRHLAKLKTQQDSIPNYEGKAIDDLYGPYLEFQEALKGNIVLKYRNGEIYGKR